MVNGGKPLHGLWAAIAVLGCFALNTRAEAQPNSATSSGSSQADIVEPLSITAINDLDFGGIAVPANQGGSVQINAVSGAATYYGAAQPVCLSSAPCSTLAALFQVRGQPGRSFVIILPTSIFALPTIGSGPSLLVSAMTAASTNRPSATLGGLLNNAGRDQIRIGGTLQIPAGTPSGRYRAEIPLVVTYD